MNRFHLRLTVVFFLFYFPYTLQAEPSKAVQADDIRHPAVAGTFYPDDPKVLSGMIDQMLANVQAPDKPVELLGMILPHAGYIYSGQVAAYGYKQLSEKSYDTVILLGPSHRMSFPGISIWGKGKWETPLGEVPIDEELAAKIASEQKNFQFPIEPHLKEHSIEVHLPFLQKTLKEFKLVPIAMGRISLDDAVNLAHAIEKNITGKKILVIASTDMSHYHASDIAERMDSLTSSLVAAGDPVKLLKALMNEDGELCGAPAVLTMLELAGLEGAKNFEVMNYSHSGKVTGENDRVVGYFAVKIPRPQLMTTVSGGLLTEDEKKELLKIARDTVDAFVKTGKAPEFSPSFESLKKDQAAFVTLKKNGQLRGCIGHILPYEPLYLSVSHNAMAAASQDRRFEPVKPEELPMLEVEVNVLGIPQKIKAINEIELGREGVIVKKGDHQGVFLPEVATETGWDIKTFMNELCTQKAGLPEKCWEDPETELFTFTSQAFQ